MTILLHPCREDQSKDLARTLVLEGLAASVDVLAIRPLGQATLRIEAPVERVTELRGRLERLARTQA